MAGGIGSIGGSVPPGMSPYGNAPRLSSTDSAIVGSQNIFTYKLKDLDTGKLHRFMGSAISLHSLTATLVSKLGSLHPRVVESLNFGSASYTSAASTVSGVAPSASNMSASAPAIPNPSLSVLSGGNNAGMTNPLSISYIDDEGDFVHLETDEDLIEAVTMARAAGWGRLLLSLDIQRAAGVAAFGKAVNGMSGFVFGGGPGGSAVGGSVLSAGTSDDGASVMMRAGGGVEQNSGGGAVVPSGPTGSGAVGRPKKNGDGEYHVEGMVAPVLMASGVALVCAFLLGRAFR
jgi:hypothetical protein